MHHNSAFISGHGLLTDPRTKILTAFELILAGMRADSGIEVVEVLGRDVWGFS